MSDISLLYISSHYCYSHCDFENTNFVGKDVSESELDLILITINFSTNGAFYIKSILH